MNRATNSDSLGKHPFLLALRHGDVSRGGSSSKERGETDVFPGYQSEVPGSAFARPVALD